MKINTEEKKDIDIYDSLLHHTHSAEVSNEKIITGLQPSTPLQPACHRWAEPGV